jgi:hypothetical protein
MRFALKLCGVVVILLAAVIFSAKIQDKVRWVFQSHEYKAKIFALPKPANGLLKHIEWDGWGFPGAGNTVVYLVFDPTDSLSAATKSSPAPHFSGIPCDVDRVEQLESHWYTVLFYSGTSWEQCDST